MFFKVFIIEFDPVMLKKPDEQFQFCKNGYNQKKNMPELVKF